MKIKFFILIHTFIFLIVCQHLFAQQKKSKKDRKKEYQENIKMDSLNGVYIPFNLEDCFKQLDSFWSDSIRTEIRNMSENKFTANAHFGIGLWMRNNWGLWRGSRLSKYFNDLGIFHPDDMSGIILSSYYRTLTDQDLNIEEQIMYYKEYWKKNK